MNDLPLSELIVIGLHNFSAANGEMARKGSDLAQVIHAGTNGVNENLEKHVYNRYVVAYHGSEGDREFYLASVGKVKVCALFS